MSLVFFRGCNAPHLNTVPLNRFSALIVDYLLRIESVVNPQPTRNEINISQVTRIHDSLDINQKLPWRPDWKFINRRNRARRKQATNHNQHNIFHMKLPISIYMPPPNESSQSICKSRRRTPPQRETAGKYNQTQSKLREIQITSMSAKYSAAIPINFDFSTAPGGKGNTLPDTGYNFLHNTPPQQCIFRREPSNNCTGDIQYQNFLTEATNPNCTAHEIRQFIPIDFLILRTPST